MKRQGMRWTVLCWVLATATVAQAEPAPPEPARPDERGEATRQWLERQRQGAQASAKAQPLPGPVMEGIYERYRKSFSHPIPEHLGGERGGAAGATAR